MIGVLVMAYGGPGSLEEVEPYLLDVRGHRPTPGDVIEDVRERYRVIGGRSPILERTRAQARALEAALNVDGEHFKVFVGMRHWHPFIHETLAEMSAMGIRRVVGLVMAPHYSRMSIGEYFRKVAQADSGLEFALIESWNLLPGYLDALAARVQAALERFPQDVRERVPVIYTAHSLPERILEWGDPYPGELQATVEGLARRLGQNPYEFSYQSAAISDDPWLGPDAGEVIERLASEGHKYVLIAPVGFVCEHVEVLYDVDVVYKQLAGKLDMQLERIEMLETAPAMIQGLANLVMEMAETKEWV